MNPLARTPLYCAISFFLCTAAADAAERSNIRGMGMARTFVACSRGLDAAGVNPAALGFPDGAHVMFSIVPAGVYVGSDFLNYDLYTNYFTGVETDSGRVGRHLTQADKENILRSFRDDVARSTAEAEVRLFGLLVRLGGARSLAFTVTEYAGIQADLPRDYATFLLMGNTPGSRFDFSNTRVQATWRREYALSFGTLVSQGGPLGALTVGASAKLVEGYGYYEVQRFNTTLSTAQNGVLNGSVDFLSRQAETALFTEGSGEKYGLFPEAAGSGVGFDFGIASQVTPFLTVGASVTDIGSIRWSKGVEAVRAESTLVVDDPLVEPQRSAIEDVIKGRRSPAAAFSTGLPTTLRIGASLDVHRLPAFERMPGELLIALDYNQGLQEAPGTTTTPRVSAGFEYKPISWLPLRGGASIGGTDHFNFALGFGIHAGPVELDVASENTEWLTAPKSFSRGSLAVGLTVGL